MMVKYLITGSSGFVGRHLIEACESNNIDFEVLRRREINPIRALEDHDISIVIHLAGRAHIFDEKSQSSYQDYYLANCQYALDIVNLTINHGLKRFVYVSSIAVYGRRSSQESIYESSKINPVGNYAKSKLEAEKKLSELSEKLGFELVIVRPSLVYGPDAPGNINRILNLTNKMPIIPIAEKYNKRSLIYVGNLVDFLLLVSKHPNANGRVFNIADDQPISTYELISNLATGIGKAPLLFSLPTIVWKIVLKIVGKKQLYEQLFESLVLDMSKVNKYLGWKPKYKTKDALKLTGEKFRKNQY